MAIFPTFFFLQFRPSKCLLQYCSMKNGFLAYKKKKFKNWHFCKGNTGQENVFYDILEWKNAFLGYKNNKFKKFKNWHFCKGVNPWFWSKNGHFSNPFFLVNIGQENVFYDILEWKNAFLGHKNNKLKKSQISNFSKGVNAWFWSKNGDFSNFFFFQCRPRKCHLQYSRIKNGFLR